MHHGRTAGLALLAFGHVVRLQRGRLRLTQERLAERMCSRRQHISNIEQGKVNPSLLTIVAVAEALEIPLSELLAHAERACRRPL